ncbi:hypothetical protein PHLGIDRAFT_120269 [Phlebiopsis gigantea 11061_1 CR5-6]|uniref:Uncharacterized protein n=1 Tax=Phlebiopsis gigantea (strain 11061_1 CR5-6) TaxID=745531 RepID=A0A0C3S7V4_PHLG1|nr:hypothetical protein PHLGIDRAFT_120269 [Phlebiopsis gigantea 11061_1 CR5-6]
MLEAIQARGLHRRLKARFSPTQLFPITPLPTDDPATQPTNTATPATDTPAPATSARHRSGHPSDLFVDPDAFFDAFDVGYHFIQLNLFFLSDLFIDVYVVYQLLQLDQCVFCYIQHTFGPNPLGASVPTVTQTSTYSYHASQSFASLGASASASATGAASTTGSSVQVGPIIGIVVAVIAGVVGIIFAVTYFMRRSSRNIDDDYIRRQSMILPDDPSPFAGSRGFAPRPSSMVEKHGSDQPVSFGAQQYMQQDYHGYSNHDSFNPGQVVAMPPQAWSPVGPGTPHSGQPFFHPMGDTPVGSPISPGPYDSAYNAQGQLVRQPSAGANAFLERHGSNGAEMVLNRQPSSGPHAAFNRQPSLGPHTAFNRQPSPGPPVAFNRQPSPGPGAALNREPSTQSPYLTRQSPSAAAQIDPPPEAHYVDLNRSSVSPFQAAQYVEIANHLQAEPPAPLPTPMVAAAADEIFMKEDQLMPSVTTPRPLNVSAGRLASPTQRNGPSPFADPAHEDFGGMHVDDLPAPPSPAYSSMSRVDSSPPKLPELAVQERAFSPVTMDFPMSPPGHQESSPLAAPPTDFPVTPSEAHFADVPPTPRVRDTPSVPRPDTTYTVYDDDDAYGGI